MEKEDWRPNRSPPRDHRSHANSSPFHLTATLFAKKFTFKFRLLLGIDFLEDAMVLKYAFKEYLFQSIYQAFIFDYILIIPLDAFCLF